MKLCTELQHPAQPIGDDGHGCTRFKANQIVSFLAESRLNELATMGFPEEDWRQLAQLLGYSVSGYGDLSYAQALPGHVHAMDILAAQARESSSEDLTPEQAEIAALKELVADHQRVLQAMKTMLDEVPGLD